MEVSCGRAVAGIQKRAAIHQGRIDDLVRRPMVVILLSCQAAGMTSRAPLRHSGKPNAVPHKGLVPSDCLTT